MPHFCLFANSRTDGEQPFKLSLIPNGRKAWAKRCLPLDFHNECLLHLAIFGLGRVPLVGRRLVTVFEEDTTLKKNYQFDKRVLAKAVIIDSSHNRDSFHAPLFFKIFLTKCIKSFHKFDSEDYDGVDWFLNGRIEKHLNNISVPYLGKENSYWPEPLNTMPRLFGLGRETHMRGQVDFVAEANLVNGDSIITSYIAVESTFGNHLEECIGSYY